MAPSFKNADRLALDFLARRVRFLSFVQLGRIVAPEARDFARAGKLWAERFQRARLVECFTVMARNPSMPTCLAEYQMGGSVPDFQALARTLKARAEGSDAQAMEVVRLGVDSQKLFSTKQPRLPRRSEVSHDLQLSEVALALEERGEVEEWWSEAELVARQAYQGVVPDAEARLKDGRVVVIECGGSYSRGKLARFHASLVHQLGSRGVSGYLIV